MRRVAILFFVALTGCTTCEHTKRIEALETLAASVAAEGNDEQLEALFDWIFPEDEQ